MKVARLPAMTEIEEAECHQNPVRTLLFSYFLGYEHGLFRFRIIRLALAEAVTGGSV